MSKESFELDLHSLTKNVPETTRKKGLNLFYEGAVRDLRTSSNRLFANVQGSNLYKVELVNDGRINAYCTCQAAKNYLVCKHAIAVAYAFADEHYDDEDEIIKSEKMLVEEYLLTLEKKQLVDLLVSELVKDAGKWNGLVTKLSFKNANISLTEMRQKIQIAFPEVEYDNDDWYDDCGYFDSAATQLEPLWENLIQFTLDEQWDLLVMIWNRMNEVFPCFHYGDQTGEIGKKLQSIMPSVFQDLPWSEQDKMAWLMEYVVVKDDDEYFEVSDLLIEPFKSNPLLIELCKKQLENLPSGVSRWRFSTCASIVENNAKDWREILTVKMQMANGLSEFLKICDLYLQNGEEIEAEYFLSKTRKKFSSERDQEECDRQEIKIRHKLGEKNEAWRIANKIFDKSPSYREFKTLLATQAVLTIEDKELLKRAEKRLIEAANKKPFIANDVLKFYLLNEEFDKGNDWSKKHQLDLGIKMQFYEKAIALYPKEAVMAFIEAAEEEVSKTGNASYQKAINILLKIEKMLQPDSKVLPFFYQQAIEISRIHKAKRNFIALFNKHFEKYCV